MAYYDAFAYSKVKLALATIAAMYVAKLVVRLGSCTMYIQLL